MINYFLSDDIGAPTVNGQAGSLIGLLDACIVNGYNLQSVVSATYSAGVVTLTLNSGHGLQQGKIIRVSGADQADYNGDFKVTASSNTTAQYAITGSPVSPATGTITAKVAPLGWSKPFADTNKAAYQPSAGTQKYIRVDDTTTTYGTVYGLETMSGLDIFTPATGYASGYIRKSNVADTSTRKWAVIGDAKRVFVITCPHSAAPNSGAITFFGDVVRSRIDDPWCFLFSACNRNESGYIAWGNTLNYNHNTANNMSTCFLRSISQLGSVVSAFVTSGTLSSAGGWGDTTLVYPGVADNGLYFAPVYAIEKATYGNFIRGIMPGMYAPFQRSVVNQFYWKVNNVVIDGAARELLILRVGVDYPDVGSYGNIAIDLTGAWGD